MKKAGRTVKKELFRGLSVTSEQEITQLHLRKNNHCSLVKSCAANSGRVEAVISRYAAYYSLCESVSNLQLKFDFQFQFIFL